LDKRLRPYLFDATPVLTYNQSYLRISFASHPVSAGRGEGS
jgi:hypothetical protein